MKQRLFLLFGVLACISLTFGCAVSKNETMQSAKSTDTNSENHTEQQNSESILITDGQEQKSYIELYREILEANEESMKLLEYSYQSIGGESAVLANSVYFADMFGDETPEMIYLTTAKEYTESGITVAVATNVNIASVVKGEIKTKTFYVEHNGDTDANNFFIVFQNPAGNYYILLHTGTLRQAKEDFVPIDENIFEVDESTIFPLSYNMGVDDEFYFRVDGVDQIPEDYNDEKVKLIEGSETLMLSGGPNWPGIIDPFRGQTPKSITFDEAITWLNA